VTPLAPAAASPSQAIADPSAERMAAAYRHVRNETECRAAPLSAEDQVIQSMPDASPAKWHRAHTTWFFEQFLLAAHCPGYTPFHPRYAYLFNSYYVGVGARHKRAERGLVTRPSASEVTDYRRYVDEAVLRFLSEADKGLLGVIAPIMETGLNHEQQHQELMLTDILHAFAQNPVVPAYNEAWTCPRPQRADDAAWLTLTEGIHTVGHQGRGFHFDNERPAHRALVGPVKLARHLVTNEQWLEFIEDGGYRTPSLWLMDGFAIVESERWRAPEHWREIDGAWHVVTLGGLKPVDPAAAVSHVSYYEADAFARWSGKHLPTETEWEVAAQTHGLHDAFGIVWQWTRSAYAPYPGYRAPEGAIGEYNGKFMINQLVLRGSSLATPDGHSRITYRNFFYPHQRWQFTGLRLADYGT